MNKWLIEKSLPNNHTLTTETNIFEVTTVHGGRKSNKQNAFLQDERWHPNLERKSEIEDRDSAASGYRW